MATVVKLQKIGNSVRATIPKDVLEELTLKQGDNVIVSAASDNTICLKRKTKRRTDKIAQFYGMLSEKTEKVGH